MDSHFFNDLGADSMVMAQFCARVRKRPELPSVSMKDVYQHPTIRSLASALAGTTPPPPSRRPRRSTGWPAPAAPPQYVLCGMLQLLFYLGYAYLGRVAPAPGLRLGLRRLRRCSTPTCGRRCSAARCSSLCTFPVVAKWVLIGRWKPQQIRIWSLAYVRFWIVKTLVRANPALSVRRLAAVRALPAGAGGEDRARRRDPLPARARLHRPAHHRRRHGHPQGLVLHLLPRPRRPDPDGRGHPRARTCSSARRRCSTSRPRWATGPSWAMPPPCTPGRPFPPGSAGTGPRRAHRRGLPGGRPGRLRQLETGGLQRPAAAAGAAA